MEGMILPDLRDFVYLDVERVKSLLAQLDRGLLTDRSDSVGSSAAMEGKAGVSIPALIDVGGASQYVSTDQSTETRTLHDFVYNQTEEKLLERERIKRLPQDFSSVLLLNQEVRATLSPVEYVLVRGQLSFNDYRYMMTLLDNINDLIGITIGFSHQQRLDAAVGKEKSSIQQQINQEISSSKLDEKYVKNLRKIFEIFLKDRLIIKITPFPEDSNIRIVGPLRIDMIRDSMDDIRYKFGSSPAAQWTVFGQIAAVPQVNDRRETLDLAFSDEFTRALQNMFSSVMGVEYFFRVNFPEIAITPIAIYRD